MREASQMIDMAHMLTAVLYIQLIHNIIFEHIVQEIFFMPNKSMINNLFGIYTFETNRNTNRVLILLFHKLIYIYSEKYLTVYIFLFFHGCCWFQSPEE